MTAGHVVAVCLAGSLAVLILVLCAVLLILELKDRPRQKDGGS